jgi:hypothetical protein
MLIDYLRYQAFAGRFRGFFEDGLYNYVDPEHSTGQHLRFSPEWIDSRWGIFGYEYIQSYFDGRCSPDLAMSHIMDRMRVRRYSDGIKQSNFSLGNGPPSHRYDDEGFAEMQIVIDVDPKRWEEKRYSENPSYEGASIVYRRSGPARANYSAGDRLVDKFQKRGGYGTLCGIFQTDDGRAFGLTCGHVTRDRGEVLIEHPRRFWRFEFGSTFTSFGSTRHHTMCGPEMKIGRVTTQLDAALIGCNRRIERTQSEAVIGQAFLKPISSVLQEEPVKFRGASRHRSTPARISALTVRKSIDLFNDGNLHSVGDVLMLGHRERMYIVQPVSRPGDSGAAVRFGLSESGPFELINQWYGMVLGGDEHSAYASHAECIWAWVGDTLSTRNLDFYF